MTQSNLKIAITGGIGSGKSTVAKIIADEGYSVISCDVIYNQLLCKKNFLSKICDEFGDVLNDEGGLDRKKLSSIVFADKNKLKKLNGLAHPAIMTEALSRMSGSGIFFCEVPLLFEEGLEKLFDSVIVVLREMQMRVDSVVKRDKTTENEVISRINSQYNYEMGRFDEYYVIHNNSNLTNLRLQTLKIIDKINNQLL